MNESHETLQRLTALQSSRLLQLVAECKRLAGLAGIRDYSVPGLDAPPAVVSERWRAEMPKFEPITEQWRYAFAPEKVIADYKRANSELDAAETENRELREKAAALELEAEAAHERIRELQEHYDSARRVCDEAQATARARQDEVAALEARIRELRKALYRAIVNESMEGTWCTMCRTRSTGGKRGPEHHPHEPRCPLFLPSTEGGEG